MIRFFTYALFAAFVGMASPVFAAGEVTEGEPNSIEDLLGTSIADDTIEADVATTADDETKKILEIKKTGLPIPRFVSLKRNLVNVRTGPGETFGIMWTFTRRNLPVEIITEYDNWREIRDHFGEQGWVYGSLLSSERYALLNPWDDEGFFTMHKTRDENSNIVAKLEVGVLGQISECDGVWCQLTVETYKGYIKQEFLWGIYLGDNLK
ncbi:MAG: hypothetical protein HRU29_13060 [Rhizobiales bacterium]|nr:SH3 domain-containing protein [Hyphomicrobiales bacterium]NRB15321.1 hypothetical protein [Hyphomicrobiales bacterium]